MVKIIKKSSKKPSKEVENVVSEPEIVESIPFTHEMIKNVPSTNKVVQKAEEPTFFWADSKGRKAARAFFNKKEIEKSRKSRISDKNVVLMDKLNTEFISESSYDNNDGVALPVSDETKKFLELTKSSNHKGRKTTVAVLNASSKRGVRL